MKEKIEIPKSEKKEQRVSVRFTKQERKKLDDFCNKNQIKLSDLIRFSLQTIISQSKNKTQ